MLSRGEIKPPPTAGRKTVKAGLGISRSGHQWDEAWAQRLAAKFRNQRSHTGDEKCLATSHSHGADPAFGEASTVGTGVTAGSESSLPSQLRARTALSFHGAVNGGAHRSKAMLSLKRQATQTIGSQSTN